jgi:hypothetical protein
MDTPLLINGPNQIKATYNKEEVISLASEWQNVTKQRFY